MKQGVSEVRWAKMSESELELSDFEKIGSDVDAFLASKRSTREKLDWIELIGRKCANVHFLSKHESLDHLHLHSNFTDLYVFFYSDQLKASEDFKRHLDFIVRYASDKLVFVDYETRVTSVGVLQLFMGGSRLEEKTVRIEWHRNGRLESADWLRDARYAGHDSTSTVKTAIDRKMSVH